MIKSKKLTLREWRGLKLLSRRELAEITGISDRTILKYESDINALRSASYENLSTIATGLGITVDDIFLSDDSQNEK
jgi:transcriptional regulator with XRE-family HTH domain